MANNWNPNAPAIVGNEWIPTIGATSPVAQGQQSLVQRLRSTTAETITQLELAIGHNPAETDRIFTVMDIYPAGSEIAPAVSVVEYPPNADENVVSWTTQSGGTTNLFQSIDDALVYPPVGSDYIRMIASGVTGVYRCSVASGAFPLTARVLRVSIGVVIGMVSLGGTAFVEFNLFHQPSSTTHSPPGNILFTNGLIPNQVSYIDCGEINPQTNLPWSPADIRSFDAGDWHVRAASPNGTGTNGPIITALALRVSYIDPDNRVAVGTWRRPSGALPTIITTDDLVELSAGAWVANWTKPASGDFSFCWRWGRDKLVGGAAPIANDIVWHAAYQDLGTGGNPPGTTYSPVPGMVAAQLATTEHGLITTDFDDHLLRRNGRILLRTSTPGDSNDSQPYTMLFDGNHLRTLDSAQTIAQRITSPGANSYLGVRFCVIPPDTADATLTITVRTTAGAQVGTGSFTITADEVRALPDIGSGLRYVEGFFSTSVVLAAATQYDIRMAVSTTDDWLVLTPYAHSGDGGPSFGGTTDSLRVAGVQVADADAMLAILIQPAAPTEMVTRAVAVPRTGSGCLCTVEAVDQITVEWEATALGNAFAAYEIERLDSRAPGVWDPVGRVTSSEATTHWTDEEPPRNRPVKYRLRVMATTAAFSDWVVGEWVEADTYSAEMIFASNQEPGLTVAVEWEPTVATDFPDHDADVLVPLFGSDNVVAFMEPEDRGIVRQVRLIVSAADAPCDNLGNPLPDTHVWDPLRAISRASLPYVCVLDHRGNRTQAHVRLGNGESVYDAADRLQFHWVDATITPVGSGRPTVAER